MWRDRFDELVEDLERLAPRPDTDYHVKFLKLQQLTDAILYGSPSEVEALQADPDYQEWTRRFRESHGRPEIGATSGARSR